MYQEPNIYNALPKLPGLNFDYLNQPSTFNKSHIFTVEKGMRDDQNSIKNNSVMMVKSFRDVVNNHGVNPKVPGNGATLLAGTLYPGSSFMSSSSAYGSYYNNSKINNSDGSINNNVKSGSTLKNNIRVSCNDQIVNNNFTVSNAAKTIYNNTNINNKVLFAPSTSTSIGGASSPSNNKVPPFSRPIDTKISRDTIFRRHPQWKSLLDKNLRFFGYFMEKVEESMVERQRVRKVCVIFHLYDSTIEVIETPSVVNSGLYEGTIMHRYWDPSIIIEDLKIGSTINLRAINIHLIDCDAFTRSFYQSMDIPISIYSNSDEPLEYPQDVFEEKQLAPTKIYDKNWIETKRINDCLSAAATGKIGTFLTPAEREKARNFYEHDREVLVFYAVWDDRRFKVNMHIADGTISVANVHGINDGRDPNEAFIKRSYIPKNPKGKNLLKTIDTVTLPPVVEYIKDLDLETGTSINILGRDFYLYGCDDFTKEYYMRRYGIEMKDYEKPPTEGDVVARRPFLKREKERKRDFTKFIRQADDVLTFAAELYNPSPTDEGREFIITYHLEDDTVSVSEFVVRNSGHVGGKIFSRNNEHDISSPDQMLRVGNVVAIGGFKYYLKEMDERTERYLSSKKTSEDGEYVPLSNPCIDTPEDLLTKLRDCLNVKFRRSNEAYRHFNLTKSGIGLPELTFMFKECELKPIPPKDVLVKIFDLVDQDRDGVISMREFVEHLLKQPFTINRVTPFIPSGNSTSETANDNTFTVKSYNERLADKTKKEECDRVFKMFIDKLEARRAYIVDVFRIVSDRAVDGLIGIDEFKEAVQTRFDLNLTPSELEALVYRFFYVPGFNDYAKRRLSLKEFKKIIDT